MEFLVGILFMIIIGWVAIKSLKVVAWIVGIILLANFLSVTVGFIATLVIILALLFNHKKITDGFVIFICLAFLFGLIF